MSVRYFEILKESGHKGNYIPSGRQLPRTPPLTDVKRHLDFGNDDPKGDREEPRQNTEAGTRDQDNDVQNGTFDFNTPEPKTENTLETDNPNSMLKGMKGYQLTAGDLEFIKNMNEEKVIKKLQGDLEEVQRLWKKETMALELACASREKAQAELNKFPSFEELTEWTQAVLKMTSPLTELTGLDTKSLLAMVTIESIQKATDEKRLELARMGKAVEIKRKKEAKERGQLEKQIATEQLNIQGLMKQLSDLTSELKQEEEAYKALQMQIKTREEIKVEAEVEDTSEELQAAKSQVKRHGKERKKTVKSTEKLQDTTNQSKSIRSKRTDSKKASQTSVEDEHANKNNSETLKTSTTKQTKQKSEAVTEKLTKSVKAATGPQKKVEEQESNSKESLQAVKERRKPPGTTQTTASQPKNQTKMKTGEAQSTSQQATPSRSRRKAAVAPNDAGEEAQNTGLRRSKRIASRR
ncbi:stress response protein NST1 [Xiphias gladius]|uniref:stress response protein NST1 n=1 Tax=Xiphias gladius TaxID=8245 RepID=UPI001A990336|nr:stress response protein NST1 [Xiphias gladius]